MSGSMRTQSKAQHYTSVAKALHWAIAALLVIQYLLGWLMPDQRPGSVPAPLIDLHLSFGYAILIVVIIRLLWRATHRPPQLTEGLPVWQRMAARATHFALYALLLVIPVLGWAAASWRGWPITLFHSIPLPPLVTARQPGVTSFFQSPRAGDLHGLLGYVLLGVIALHVSAALFHRFMLRDRVLASMLPRRLEGL
jgi:cytochrome b561